MGKEYEEGNAEGGGNGYGGYGGNGYGGYGGKGYGGYGGNGYGGYGGKGYGGYGGKGYGGYGGKGYGGYGGDGKHDGSKQGNGQQKKSQTVQSISVESPKNQLQLSQKGEQMIPVNFWSILLFFIFILIAYYGGKIMGEEKERARALQKLKPKNIDLKVKTLQKSDTTISQEPKKAGRIEWYIIISILLFFCGVCSGPKNPDWPVWVLVAIVLYIANIVYTKHYKMNWKYHAWPLAIFFIAQFLHICGEIGKNMKH